MSIYLFILHYVFWSGVCRQDNSCDTGDHNGVLEPTSKIKDGMYGGV